jgi:hypothetical protein
MAAMTCAALTSLGVPEPLLGKARQACFDMARTGYFDEPFMAEAVRDAVIHPTCFLDNPLLGDLARAAQGIRHG